MGAIILAASAGMQEVSHSLIPGEFSPVPLQNANRSEMTAQTWPPAVAQAQLHRDYFTVTGAVTE